MHTRNHNSRFIGTVFTRSLRPLQVGHAVVNRLRGLIPLGGTIRI
jgi:hypothetical protein